MKLDTKDLDNLPAYDNHESVYSFYSEPLDINIFIAIHWTKAGPAVGGTRMFPYRSSKKAINDVLNLSKAMSYKCMLAGVPFGGGKGVIVGDPSKLKTSELLDFYADCINSLEGRFYTGEDVGITENDVQHMLKTSSYFIGRSDLAGDPSPFAARGVYYAMQAVLQAKFGKNSFKDVSIAIKGVGKVGAALAELVQKEGANLIIADLNEEAIAKTTRKSPNVKVSTPKEIVFEDVDILSLCALGGDITESNVEKIRAKIICGGANNQLRSERAGDMLFEKGTLYVPDYIANAGGLINVVSELNENGYNRTMVVEKISEIKETIYHLLDVSEKQEMAPYKVANLIAKDRMNAYEH